MAFYISLFFITALFCVDCNASVNNISESLYNLISSSHNKDIRPCIKCGTPLVINVTFHLTSLNDLDEVAAEMNSVGYLTITWLDERIEWDPEQFEGLTSLHMPYAKVWTPMLIVGNPTRRVSKLSGDVTFVRVMSNGQMIWSPGDVFYTTCFPNIYRYPLDTQRCFISVLPFGFLDSEITIMGTRQALTAPGYQDNGEWILENTESVNLILSSLSVVRFYFTLRRRSEFFIVNIILPIIFLSCINCLVFLLPTQSGERVSFTVTVLLSFAVFMTLVGDNIPKTSDPVPLLCYYLMSVFTGSSLIMVCTIHSVSLHHRDAKVPISGFHRLLLSLKSNACGRKTNPRAGMRVEAPAILADMERNGVVSHRSHTVQDNRSKESENEKDQGVTWQDVAVCQDKICLIGFVLYFAICSLVFLVNMSLS